MANSNLTPEQFEMLFGDSDAASASGETPTPSESSPRSSLTDEEYMILFGDSMSLTVDDDALTEDAGQSDDDATSLDTLEDDSDTTDAVGHAKTSEDGFTIWVAPEHSAPQHRAPQHSADAIVEEPSSYVGTRFSSSIEDEDVDAETDAEADPATKTISFADETPSKAPIPESVGLVDRMVSKVKQRLSEELGSSEL